MSKRVWGSVVAAVAAMGLVPSTVFADQTPPYSGSATASTLTLQVSPNALLTLPAVDIPSQVSSTLSTALDPITIQVDSGHSTASRSSTGSDLSAAHADLTPLGINLATLNTLLTELHDSLSTLTGAVSLPALSSTLSDVSTITGNSTVMGLLPAAVATDLTTLQQQLSALTTDIAALPGVATKAVDDLSSTLLGQLGSGLSLTEKLTADIDSANPDGQNTTQPAVTVPPSVSLPADVPALPASLQLAPFTATAVNAAGAKQFGVSGAQGAANSALDSATVAPSLDLSALKSAVTTLQGTLQQVKDTAATLQPLLSGVSAIIGQALPGGLDLSALQTQVDTAIGLVTSLLGMVQNLGLNSLLSCDALGTGACSLVSTSVTPEGTGLHAVTSSKLVGLSVLPMDSPMATALAPLGATAGTALLDVQGVQASTDTIVTSSGYAAPKATGSIAHIAVAGLTVVDQGQVVKSSLAGHTCTGFDPSTLPDAIPVGTPLTVCVSVPGVGALTVVVTVGSPQYANTAPSHVSASLSMLEIRLLNGDPNGANPVTALGASKPGTVATIDGPSVSSEVLAASTDQAAAQHDSNVDLQKTGMFGPGSLLVGFGLLASGVWMRRRSRRGCAPAA
jgi:hypothetical protein